MNQVYVYTPTWSQRIATMLVRDILLIGPQADELEFVVNAGPAETLIESLGFKARLGHPNEQQVLSLIYEHGVPEDHERPHLFGEVVVHELDTALPAPSLSTEAREPYILPDLARPNAFNPYERAPPPNHEGIITDGIVNVFFG